MDQARLQNIKVIFHALNGVYMILTVVNIVFVISILVNFWKYVDVVFEKSRFYILMIFFIIYDGVELIFAILGFLGDIKENPAMICSVRLLIQFDTGLKILWSSVSFHLKDEVHGMEEKPWNDVFENFNNSNSLQTMADYAHQQYECCGGYNYKEWGQNTPESCCKKKLKEKEICSNEDVFKDGCWEKIKKEFKMYLTSLGIIFTLSSITQSMLGPFHLNLKKVFANKEITKQEG